MTGKALKFLLSLFTLNSISLYLYFSSSSSSSSTTHHLPPPEYKHSPPEYSPSAKPWPSLPSHLPWTHKKDTSFRYCEAYFGNGFTERVDPLKPVSETHQKRGWFRCFYSATLRSSVCEGGGIRMDPERIFMSKGGEKLESVIGREEDEEMPVFGDGAFRIEVDDGSRVGEKLVDVDFLDEYVPQGGVEKHTMRGLIGSIELVDASEFDCSQWIEEPTVLVTRFEYANVFHTFTDWYSAYVASRVTALPYRPHLVFVDGHCETGLEETWRALFSSLNYAKNFSGPVCFRHAILAPLGYETPLFKGLSENIDCHGASAEELQQKPDHRKTARLSEFGEMIRASLGVPLDKNIRDPASGRNILFVRREDYRPHPRHGGRIQTRLSNEQEVFDSINKWAPNHMACKLNVVNGLFAHMSMKEQVQAIKDASVIVGAHGAGLTHIVSANPGTVILEIISSEYRRPHFQLIAMWKGLEYHAIHLYGFHANPTLVIERLERILGNLGC